MCFNLSIDGFVEIAPDMFFSSRGEGATFFGSVGSRFHHFQIGFLKLLGLFENFCEIHFLSGSHATPPSRWLCTRKAR